MMTVGAAATPSQGKARNDALQRFRLLASRAQAEAYRTTAQANVNSCAFLLFAQLLKSDCLYHSSYKLTVPLHETIQNNKKGRCIGGLLFKLNAKRSCFMLGLW